MKKIIPSVAIVLTLLAVTLTIVLKDKIFLFDEGFIKLAQQRGVWLALKKAPYQKDTFSEYPQLATLFMALPHLGIDGKLDRFEKESRYAMGFFVLTAIVHLLLLLATWKLLKRFGVEGSRILLLVLPGAFYFSFNRFDALVCLLVLVSLLLLLESRFKSAFLILGIALMTKWYPAILLGLFVQTMRDRGKKWKYIVLCLGIFATIPVLLGLATLATSGFEGLMTPYRFHGGRGWNIESLYRFVKQATLWLPLAIDQLLNPPLFLFLQAIPLLLPLGHRFKGDKERVLFAAAAIFQFVLFSPIHSPQWFLWYLPLLLPFLNLRQIIFFVIYDILTYVYYPVLTLSLGEFHGMTTVAILVLLGMRIWIWVRFVFPSFRKLPLARVLAGRSPGSRF